MLWAMAATLVEQRLAQAREEAQRPLAEARAALASAEAAITHLEAESEAQIQQLGEQQQQWTWPQDCLRPWEEISSHPRNLVCSIRTLKA